MGSCHSNVLARVALIIFQQIALSQHNSEAFEFRLWGATGAASGSHVYMQGDKINEVD